jgi:hypothetical protein
MFFINSKNDTTLVPTSNSHWWHISMCLILTLISNILIDLYDLKQYQFYTNIILVVP